MKIIEYFLNKLFYGLWLDITSFYKTVNKYLFLTIESISKVLPSKFKQEYLTWRCDKQDAFVNEIKDTESGMSILHTNYAFGYLYSCYPGVISFALFAFLDAYGNFSPLFKLIASAIPVIIAYIPAYLAVFYHDKYLQYFKIFEKRDIKWKKRCKIYALIFIIISNTVFFLSLPLYGCVLRITKASISVC